MKYRNKIRLYKLLLVVVATVAVLFILISKTPPNDVRRHCYAILTNGERFKYVYMITNQLLAQGVDAGDILIYHDIKGVGDETFPPSEFIFKKGFVYDMVSSHSNLSGLYKLFFEWIFVTNYCDTAVLLEDDIFIGEDAVEYFKWGREVMALDKTVLSVSGSHDNAERHLKLNPNVFVKAEQLLGLGWLTDRRFYKRYFARIASDKKTPWDKQLNDMMNADGLISVFPHLPRTVHVPWAEGRNGELVKLQLSMINDGRYGWPTPTVFVNGDMVKWIGDNIRGRVVEQHGFDKKKIKVKWPYSYLANRPFGKSGHTAFYPMETGDVMVVYV